MLNRELASRVLYVARRMLWHGFEVLLVELENEPFVDLRTKDGRRWRLEVLPERDSHRLYEAPRSGDLEDWDGWEEHDYADGDDWPLSDLRAYLRAVGEPVG